MARYRDYVQNLPTPSWLLGPWGQRWLYLLALVADALQEASVQAVRARFISVCPPDALPLIGRERGLEPGLGESAETYRQRLHQAWEAWEWVGTEQGLLAQLTAWLPGANWRLIANREWGVPPPGRPASPGLAAIDGADWWSRFWVLLGAPHPFSAWLIGDEELGDTLTIGSTAQPWQVEACQRIVRRWKAGHEYVPHIIVNLGTTIIGTGVPIGSFTLGGTAAYWPVN